MTALFTLLLIIPPFVLSSTTSSKRDGRHLANLRTSYTSRQGAEYHFCKVDDTEGACLKNTECYKQQGLFAGHCGNSEDVCCVVIKTCGEQTHSHHSYFRNPSFPQNDTEARVCSLTVDIGSGICGVRLTMEKFELAKFNGGSCLHDGLTVLGTKGDPVSPFCGNMTNWRTTFAVEEKGQLVLAALVQGKPAYTFNIRVTQLPCDDIQTFRSPTYAGVWNRDAPKYVRPTTESDVETTTSPTTDETTVLEASDEGDSSEGPEEETQLEEAAVEGGGGDEDDDEDEEEEEDTEGGPTTLQRGLLPTPSNAEVVIKSEQEEDDGIYLGITNPIPLVSAVREEFDMMNPSNCLAMQEEADVGFRIVGGSMTQLNEYPWQVAIINDKRFTCGGALISDRHILTASHCVFGNYNNGFENLTISLGDHDLMTKNDTENVAVKVKYVDWNLHYNAYTITNDIAVLELESPVTFREGISAVKLPTDLDDQFEGQNATLTGWGRHKVDSYHTSPVLKEYAAPLVDIDECIEAWEEHPSLRPLPSNVCLNVTWAAPCHGDSGSPLVTCSGLQCTQIGVMSFGSPSCTNVGLPEVFTRVTHYMPWLDMTLTPIHYV
ncbi:serine protease filzig-like [Penaeus japonicus]|uniref:serine protease filzig-like n=1 Tax=Penaeus japonicus TaxID=27405 RepID=UPI001C70E1F6|nr:serine protease filzig-like [Penaeus japonicus]